jgi:methionine-rich copper-binding protein CopC
VHRQVATLAIVALLACFGSQHVSAHAGPRLTDPLEGATLGDTPTIVRLSFSEKPEASLSFIRVLDVGGTAYHVGSPQPVPGDPLALSVPVKPLGRGVYVVNWRIISAIDGHVTTGAYAFGVQMSPIGARAASITYPPASMFEVLSRWAFIAGAVLLVGALSATIAGFGGRRDRTVAAGGCLLSMIGVLALVEAQRRTAGVSLTVLFGAAVGRSLLWRAAAVGAAGAALALSYGARPGFRHGGRGGRRACRDCSPRRSWSCGGR